MLRMESQNLIKDILCQRESRNSVTDLRTLYFRANILHIDDFSKHLSVDAPERQSQTIYKT